MFFASILKYPLKIINSEQQGILLSGDRIESKLMMSIRSVIFSPPHQHSNSFPSAVADVVTIRFGDTILIAV